MYVTYTRLHVPTLTYTYLHSPTPGPNRLQKNGGAACIYRKNEQYLLAKLLIFQVAKNQTDNKK